MIQRRTLTAVLVMTTLLATLPAVSLAAPSPRVAQQATNLLSNPGFEGIECAPSSAPGWCDDNWTRTTHTGAVHDNIFTPQGWVTWWRTGEGYGQPEVKTIPRADPFIGPPARIRSGNYAALFFTYHRNHDGGFYQVVDGLTPGTTVQASAHAHGWSCDTTNQGLSCGDPWNMTFQVGIEPNGAADPYSPNIVWSGEQPSPDEYRRIGPVSATVGPNGSVTVILRSKTKWPVQHLDAYWDDASLVTTAPGDPPTATPVPDDPSEPPEEEPTETPGPSPTPLPTATPRPDGATVHVVESGETLYAIANRYNVSAEQIRRLNEGTIGPDDLIRIGQELVISVPDETPTATPEASPTPTEEPEATPAPPEEPEGASVCILAFHDRDGDGARDSETDELLPNVSFTIADASGVVDEYMTDGVSEPYCFTGLAPGTYRVIQQAPTGYEATGPTEQSVALAEGTSIDLQFGTARTEPAETPEEDEEAAPPEDEETDAGEGVVLADALTTFARVAGILVLLLAGAIAVLFVLSRRRRPY